MKFALFEISNTSSQILAQCEYLSQGEAASTLRGLAMWVFEYLEYFFDIQAWTHSKAFARRVNLAITKLYYGSIVCKTELLIVKEFN